MPRPSRARRALLSALAVPEGNESQQQGHEKSNDAGSQIIEGYVSGNTAYISRLERFNASFLPEGTLLILENHDEPGKIGSVGSVLGRYGINIRFMQVARLDSKRPKESLDGGKSRETRPSDAVASGAGGDAQPVQAPPSESAKKLGDEALMILGIDGDVTKEVIEDLRTAEGIIDVSLVHLQSG
ncbi:hypothetical protein NUW58_g5973 [Xylaria curta]|uniref:Uncharacterized protein n=1 Tax=Xylaria curta TaxID=42375 RepID=A0ACC1NZ17_9PEZI|nr:hypothetical protein NUW58_g5973 [Xylaria curta]